MGMECRLTKYTNATNESVFTDKSVNEASLSDGIPKRHKNSYIICSENKVLMSH